MELNIPKGYYAVLVDMDDVPRVIVKATGDNEKDLRLLEEGLSTEYGGEKAKFTHGQYYSHTDMYDLKFDIDDITEPGNVINYDFYMYKITHIYGNVSDN